MEENQYDTSKGSRIKSAVWACLLGFVILLVLAGFFILYRIGQEYAKQAEELQRLTEELQEAKTEKLLWQQMAAEKEQQEDPLVQGASTAEGVQDYRVYLTFDDGPCENTLKVMDILDEYQIKATFFMNGQESDLAKEVYSRAVEDGHVLANHTYSHVYKSIYESWDRFYEEILKMEQCVEQQTGYTVAKIIRFPGGSNCGRESVMREIKGRLDELGYRYFDWNVSGEDAIYADVPGSEVYQNVMRYIEGKKVAVILLHTTNKTNGTVEVLPDIIDYLLKEGYSFHTLDEQDAPTNVVFDQDYAA